MAIVLLLSQKNSENSDTYIFFPFVIPSEIKPLKDIIKNENYSYILLNGKE